jgi:hypothetical protein
MAMSDKTLKFALRELFAGSLVLLGLVMWGASFLLPAVSDGRELSPFDLIAFSLVPTPTGIDTGGWVILVILVHAVLFVSLFFLLTHPWPRRQWRRWLGTLLIAGALLFELGLSRQFEATYRGFHLWCMSFLVVGVGLWIEAGRFGPSQEGSST